MFKKTGVVHQLRWLCGQILSLDDLHPRHKERRHGRCCMGGVTVALWFMWSHPERGGYLRVITAPLLYVQVSRVGWLDDHPAYKQFGLNHAISIRKNLASKHGSHIIHLHDCSVFIRSNYVRIRPHFIHFSMPVWIETSRFGANLITSKSCDAWGCSGAQEECWEVHGHTIGQLPRQLSR